MPGDFLKRFQVPSKYILTALSILLPQLLRMMSRTVGLTLSPTKLSNVSWSNANSAAAVLSEWAVGGWLNALSISLSERGARLMGELEEPVTATLRWEEPLSSSANCRRSGAGDELRGVGNGFWSVVGSSRSVKNRRFLFGGSSRSGRSMLAGSGRRALGYLDVGCRTSLSWRFAPLGRRAMKGATFGVPPSSGDRVSPPPL